MELATFERGQEQSHLVIMKHPDTAFWRPPCCWEMAMICFWLQMVLFCAMMTFLADILRSWVISHIWDIILQIEPCNRLSISWGSWFWFNRLGISWGSWRTQYKKQAWTSGSADHHWESLAFVPIWHHDFEEQQGWADHQCIWWVRIDSSWIICYQHLSKKIFVLRELLATSGKGIHFQVMLFCFALVHGR